MTNRRPSRRVLIVEDDLDMLDAFVQVLEDNGYAAVGAANGLKALEELRSGPAPGVILLDLQMPVMDGWQFREEQLKDEALAAIPVVVVSAGGSTIGTQARALRPAALLSKPIDLDVLLATLGRVYR